MAAKYQGIWPVAPTPFDVDGNLDLEGMRRILDLMVDQGSDWICILANFSEQFLLADDEREALTRLCIEHVAGRLPVIVTISHFATPIAVERARLAKSLGAGAVMMMPPYHGATLKGTERQTFDQFEALGEVGVPIMIQDAPLSGVHLSESVLARMAREIEMVKLFKIESAGAAAKLRGLIAAGGDAIEGPFDGEEGITLLADMPGVSRERLALEVDRDTLTVEGDARIETPEGMEALYADVRSNRYRRSFALSGELDTDAIRASLVDGVLSVHIPKRAEVRPRKIEVRVE